MRNLALLAGAAMIASLAGTDARAEFPERAITMIVPFDPGGGSDLTARTVDKFAADAFGHSFTFQYRPGAGGHIGTNSVANAQPDGYTIGTYNVPHIALGPVTGVAQYTLDDFTYLGQMAGDPAAFATARNSPFTDVADFIEAARAAPGRLTIGSADQFGGTHLLALQFAELADVEVSVVPFPGGSQLVAAVLGGHVDAGFAGLPPFLGSREETTFLALAGAERYDALPEVATLVEQGVELNMTTGRIFIAPAGLDDATAERLRSGFKDIFDRADFQQELSSVGQEPMWMSGEELRTSLEGSRAAAERLFEAARQ